MTAGMSAAVFWLDAQSQLPIKIKQETMNALIKVIFVQTSGFTTSLALFFFSISPERVLTPAHSVSPARKLSSLIKHVRRVFFSHISVCVCVCARFNSQKKHNICDSLHFQL